jgi:hypothetical protein
MKKQLLQLSMKAIAWFVITFLFATVCILSCTTGLKRGAIAATDSCECYSSSILYSVPIYFDKRVPGDLSAFNNQSQADCFAWQEFVALNWPTDTAHSFGDANDLTPVQWETYMPRDVLFQPNGVPPPAWGTLVSEKYAAKFKSQRLMVDQRKTKLLTFTSKFERTDTIEGLDFGQAAPFNAPNWLGAQNSTNVWYEIMLNKDYYDFVVNNGYYNAVNQHDTVKAGKPINFPQGVYNGPVGAIELKAAWMEVDNPSSSKWKRYKLSEATVLDATTGKLRNTIVALVGLHILHKTTNQPTWVWATFEQIDNVPDDTDHVVPPDGYNFYSNNCTVQKFTVKNAAGTGDTTVTVSCTANTSPPYYLSQGTAVPIQISRVNAIDQQDAAPINKKMQATIKQFFPNSVWQYYQLIDVIWSQSLQPNPTTPIASPRVLNTSAMASGATIVANSTLESYVQKTNTCISCHVYSTIASYPQDTANNNIFGDFSFAIGAATYPASTKKK